MPNNVPKQISQLTLLLFSTWKKMIETDKSLVSEYILELFRPIETRQVFRFSFCRET